MDNIKILIADDHAMIRDGLKLLFSRNKDFSIVGEAASGADVVEKFKATDPDLVILDISMPDMNGMEAAKEILVINPLARIIILSMYNEEEYISYCIEAGVKGYVVKSEVSSELEYAVNAVIKGSTYFSQKAQEVIFKKYSRNIARKRKEEEIKLTVREMEIVKLISEGLTSNQIADKLFISPRTVDTHRANLMKKLNVKNSIELIKKMDRIGILNH